METYERYKQAIDTWEFHGTEHYYRCMCSELITDGAKWLCDSFECYWLVDLLAGMIKNKGLTEYFMVATITVTKGDEWNKAEIKITDGNYKELAKQSVPATDMPEGEYALWIANGKDLIMYLNTEH